MSEGAVAHVALALNCAPFAHFCGFTVRSGYAFNLPVPLILCAVALDWLAGDPEWLPHPVWLIGGMIAHGERLLWSGDARSDLCSGAILVGAVIAAAAGATWTFIALAAMAGNLAAATAALMIAWTSLALRGLDRAAAAVGQALSSEDLMAARREIRALVGRDADCLDRSSLLRATVESVAENSCDGVIAPMLYLFAGGPVMALAYKAVNTLDSMIGYADQRYYWFGRAAARLDDLANLLPARITALCLIAAAAVVSRRSGPAYAACVSSASRHRSPNAGYPESVMAGALGIQLGGDAVYGGEVEHRAAMGFGEREPALTDIRNARRMMRIAATLAFCLFTLGHLAVLRFLV